MREVIAKALQPLPQYHIHELVVEGIFNPLVPHFTEDLVEVLQLVGASTLTCASVPCS